MRSRKKKYQLLSRKKPHSNSHFKKLRSLSQFKKQQPLITPQLRKKYNLYFQLSSRLLLPHQLFNNSNDNPRSNLSSRINSLIRLSNPTSPNSNTNSLPTKSSPSNKTCNNASTKFRKKQSSISSKPPSTTNSMSCRDTRINNGRYSCNNSINRSNCTTSRASISSKFSTG